MSISDIKPDQVSDRTRKVIERVMKDENKTWEEAVVLVAARVYTPEFL